MRNDMKKVLFNLGFVEEKNDFLRLSLPLIYSAESIKVQIFCFEKEGNIFLSEGGALLSNYDVPSIDYENELKNIQKIFFDRSDLLVNGHILKKLSGDAYSLEKEVSQFVKLILKVEDYFENL